MDGTACEFRLDPDMICLLSGEKATDPNFLRFGILGSPQLLNFYFMLRLFGGGDLDYKNRRLASDILVVLNLPH